LPKLANTRKKTKRRWRGNKIYVVPFNSKCWGGGMCPPVHATIDSHG